jgi:hypothetical protein
MTIWKGFWSKLCLPNRGTVPEFALEGLKEKQNTSVKIAAVPAEIRIEHLPNTSPDLLPRVHRVWCEAVNGHAAMVTAYSEFWCTSSYGMQAENRAVSKMWKLFWHRRWSGLMGARHGTSDRSDNVALLLRKHCHHARHASAFRQQDSCVGSSPWFLVQIRK